MVVLLHMLLLRLFVKMLIDCPVAKFILWEKSFHVAQLLEQSLIRKKLACNYLIIFTRYFEFYRTIQAPCSKQEKIL